MDGNDMKLNVSYLPAVLHTAEHALCNILLFDLPVTSDVIQELAPHAKESFWTYLLREHTACQYFTQKQAALLAYI